MYYRIKELFTDGAINYYDDKYASKAEAKEVIKEYINDDNDPDDPRIDIPKYFIVECDDDGDEVDKYCIDDDDDD